MAEVQGANVGLYLSGQPVKVTDCNIAIVQPTIKDIVVYGEDEFLIGINLLGHPENIIQNIKEGNSQLEAFSDFQLLLVTIKEETVIRDSILKLLNLICPDYEIKIEDGSIDFYVQQGEEKFIGGRVHAFNFQNLQNAINDLFAPHILNDSEPEYNPANAAAAEIAKKIKEGRARKNQAAAEKEGPQSMFGRYTSILSIGLQMDINIFFNYTPFQLYDTFNRYFTKVSHDFYMKVSTTPLMDVSKMEEPKEWTRNLY